MPIGGASQEAWFRAVNHLARATPWLHGPARLFAEYGVGLFAVLLLLSWWSARRDGDPRRVAAALWAPVGALVALGLNQLLVATFAEPRPFTVVPDALVLVTRSTDPSFPSDHSVMAGAVAVGILLAQGRRVLTGVTLGLAVLMAATRVYVGAHFPLDVLAGLLVGAAIALASYRLVRPLAVRLVEAVGRTPGRVLVRG
ncbi:phosphatase PAP2 family protein [Pimelobacter simplex]|uniref:Phosphatase PAP2 family protein n=1 Tax=Nocardioides simplex TaxID=2045 RepID=A0A7J5DTM1_NOCSI|nr:phosphatase PAP2 family protein [Pimelobacter simplex]KAB2808524.1 phosphatase PAP2 family protein [Pimelobacter simplex]